MARNDETKRDRMAYLALYYAIQGNIDRSEKIRATLRQSNEAREWDFVDTRQSVSVF